MRLSLVTRPRTHPLLSKFETECGEKYIWTTFSDDQIDLNFENPKVLVKMVEILLFYLEMVLIYMLLLDHIVPI